MSPATNRRPMRLGRRLAWRRLPVEAWGWLGSWRLSVVLMVAGAFYYALLAIWASSSTPQMVRNIASLLPFWLVYLLVLVNTVVCFWRRLPSLHKETAPRPFLAERPCDWQRSLPVMPARTVAALLRSWGYRRVREEASTLWAVRGRFSALGSYLFHGAFFLVAIGFLTSFAARQEARVWVAEGEALSDEGEQILAYSPPRLLGTPLEVPHFSVRRIAPALWRDELLFTRLEAELELSEGRRRATTRINRPLWIGWCTFLRLSGFGLTPRWELHDRDQTVLDSAFVKLDVFPPGQRDSFRAPGYPHRFYVEVLPDLRILEGEAVTGSLNLSDPAVRLEVYRGHLDLGRALLRPQDAYRFEGLEIRFPEIRYWGEFTAVFDPGAPVLFFGYLVGLVGLLVRAGGRRQEVQWHPGVGRESVAGVEQIPGVLRGWGGDPPPQLETLSDEPQTEPIS